MQSSILTTPLFVLGIMTILSLYAGKAVKKIKLPSIIGFMITGVFFGPSCFKLIDNLFMDKMSFITEIALGFVAISIGLELSFRTLKSLGSGIIYIILFESLGAFVLTAGAVYLYTNNIALSIIFGAIAPASAPAGTVAVIKEYKAKGTLTQALYAVVGFDDGLGIIIFGFASAAAKLLLTKARAVSAVVAKTGAAVTTTPVDNGFNNFIFAMSGPLKEVFLSVLLGTIFALGLCWLARKMDARASHDLMILLFGGILCSSGLSVALHLSLILTNMVIGIIIVNTQPNPLVLRVKNEISGVIPLLFVFFFSLAGATLHIDAVPSLGVLGIIYIIGRTTGLISGAWLGAALGKSEEKIKKYLGLGILSQAGVAIGLALIVKQEFKGLGPVVSKAGEAVMTMGDQIGFMAITTVTASCIFFEIIGPILARHALIKANEIKVD